MMCCASCGKAEVDDIKLRKCTACYLVKYCSITCQKEHRPKHKKECKKRAAELRDEILFKQPESSDLGLGDCPICCLPLQYDRNMSILTECCCKLICVGCDYANDMREKEGNLQRKCPYCRQPTPSEEEFKRNLTKRAEANDPLAMCRMGATCHHEGDYDGAFEYWTKAAGLGDLGAHYNLAVMYGEGQGVEKDEKKRVHHLEEAAIGGYPNARHYLANFEVNNGRMDRALKHLIIAANLGDDSSLEGLKSLYREGLVSKEDLASALRGHQAAVDVTKSAHREEAKADRRLT